MENDGVFLENSEQTEKIVDDISSEEIHSSEENDKSAQKSNSVLNDDGDDSNESNKNEQDNNVTNFNENEESDEEDVCKSRHVQKKRMHFDDSEEESNKNDEETRKSEERKEDDQKSDLPDLSNENKVTRKSRLIQLCDSDSDREDENKENEKPKEDILSEESDIENILFKTNQKGPEQNKNEEASFESDEENMFSKTNQRDLNKENSFESNDQNILGKQNIIFSADEEESEGANLLSQEKRQRLKNLCDSESFADEEQPDERTEYREEIHKLTKKRKKNDDLLEKPRSGKEAVEQRRVIQSESQRMVRESRVHLPYHRPKAHTLQEFLKRRSKIEIKAPPNTPTTFCIKMSAEQLASTAKRMEEQERETENFFKSDDEDESEIPKDNLVNIDDRLDTAEFNLENGDVSENDKLLKETDLTNNKEEPDKLENSDKQIEISLGVNSKILEPSLISNESNLISNNSETDYSIPDLNGHENSNTENCDHANTNHEALIIDSSKNVNSIPITSDAEHSCNDNTNHESSEYVNIYSETCNIENSIHEQSNNEHIKDDNSKNENSNLNIATTLDETISDVETDKNVRIEEEKIQELRETLEKYIGKSTKSLENNTQLKESTKDSKLEENLINIDIDKIEPTSSDIYKLNVEQKLKRYNPLVNLKLNFQPRLSGGPNDVVVLDDEIEKKKCINKLMQRFVAHTAKKVTHKKHEVKITNLIHGVIHQETIVLKNDEEDEEPARKFQTPGEKMKKLRKELEEQIAKTREEEWNRLINEQKKDNEDQIYEGEKTECGLIDEILDDNEEEEMTDTDPSSESEEEEEEEDYVEMKENPRVKSAFVDDEAEDSEEEDKENDLEMNAQDDDTDEGSNESDSAVEAEVLATPGLKKTLRRILTTFDDSDEEVEPVQKNVITSVELFTSEEKQGAYSEDDEIPAYQPQQIGLKTPCRPQTQNPQDLTFLTPTFHLTALQGMNTGSKSLEGSPVILLPPDPSPLKSHPGLKTKLFDDENADDLDELEELCSGRFTGTLDKDKELSIYETELMEMCSGKFDGATQMQSEKQERKIGDFTTKKEEYEAKKFETKHISSKLNKISNDGVEEIENLNTDKEGHTQKEDQNNAKQLPKAHERIEFNNLTPLEGIILDETNRETEENNQNLTINLQNSKDKHEILDQNRDSQKRKFNTITESDHTNPKLILATSSEDETHEQSQPKKKKKLTKKKRRYIIDDISITDEDEVLNDEFSDLEGDNEEVRGNVNYDSEENEIDMEEERIQKQRASEFFEAEAELSGSDWGSADEDEKDLDDLEFEAGDDENINEKKIQRELERMHVRQVLDEDKRDVRLLQELLLEDGELHGTGREKKFKWKNADSVTWNETEKPKVDDEEVEDIETELQWRKARHEREMFLKEQKLKNQVLATEDEILGKDSKILKFGKTSLKIVLPNTQAESSTPNTTPIGIPNAKSPFSLGLFNKRGSFLARSDTTLARLAQMTRSTSSVSGAKNSRNFVFRTIDKTEIKAVENEKKRKAELGTPKALKKLKIGEFSPALQKFKKNSKP